MGGQALWVRARLELGSEAGADTQGDLSLPKLKTIKEFGSAKGLNRKA